ncbi:MAG: hypothetical protein JW825_00545 [Candidatus Methanofastidiosa archaeon]|nr:hypothetical protein [Candidatus Methanofastidiosa archaeon]
MACLRIAYDGSEFSGSQRQPNCMTVENSIIEALISVGYVNRFEELTTFRMASRTDKGVSARENLLNIECPNGDLRKNNMLERMNNSLDPIWITGFSGDVFKMPLEKTYHYHMLDHGYDLQLAGELCNLFSGNHDYANLSKFDPRKETTRHLDMDYEFNGDTISLMFSGRGFLWQMCRRIATVFIECLEERMTIEEVDDILNRRSERKVMPADAKGLILYSIRSNIGFEDVPSGLEKAWGHYAREKDNAKLALGISRDFISDG